MNPLDRVLSLSIWQGRAMVQPLGGGMTNVNFRVQGNIAGQRRDCVVRIGNDIGVHHVLRFNEMAASRAAHAAGVSPEVIHHEPGVLVIGYVEGRTLCADDFADPGMLDEATALVARVHRDMPQHLRGPAMVFWVFHVIRDYAATLSAAHSRHMPLIPLLLADAAQLEAAVGPIDMVYSHNDLLPANFLHDGRRLWLIDWDYAGFNSPLFDLGGLAANASLGTSAEVRLLTTYFGAPPDAGLWRRYRAMKAAAALREMMWSMVSEVTSDIDFDYVTYTGAAATRWHEARTALEDC